METSKKTFNTYCPCCRETVDFDTEYIFMNSFRDALFFICEKCDAIFFTDTFGREPIAYHDNEKIVDLREEAYDENGEYIL